MEQFSDIAQWAKAKPIQTFGVALALTIGFLLLRLVYLLYLHPLAKYPGPLLARWTNYWKVQVSVEANWDNTLFDLHEKYGPVVRIAPNEVSLNMPSEVRKVYGVGGFLKGPFYHASDFGSGFIKQSILSARDPATHNHLRRYMAPPYNFAFLQSLEGFCDNATDLADAILLKHDKDQDSFDMSSLVGWYTFDSAAMLGFGRSQGFLENGADHRNLISNIGKANHLSTCVGGSMPSIGWIFCTPTFRKFSALMGRLTGDTTDLGALFADAAEKATERILRQNATEKTGAGDTRDMLSRMIGEKNPTTGKILAVPELIGAAQSIIGAGGDTTRISMNSAIYYIYSNARVLAKAREEIATALEAGECDWPLPYRQGAKLEYIQACMKEAMRIFPAVGMSLQRVVPKGGATLDGHYFPGGTLVGMQARVIHYNVEAYGKDAREYRPERWLVEQEERQTLERYFLTFGQGPRICLGRNISLMEMSKFMPYLIWHYDVEITNPDQPWDLHGSWFLTQTNFMCRVKRRDL